MPGYRWARTSARVLAAFAVILASAVGADASLDKQDGSPPLVMPGTLLVEAGERVDGSSSARAASKSARTVADAKMSPRTCAAAAVSIPRIGTRIVTARHCGDHRMLEVIDEQHQLTPVAEVDARQGVDLAVLETGSAVPWPGLVMRSASTVQMGERLCAWHLRRGSGGIVRDRICGRVAGREAREVGAPLLIMNHPYPAGTSGSALVDRAGRVVGIVVASTGLTGIAEPIDEVLRFPASKAHR
jgi:hypothetical protein